MPDDEHPMTLADAIRHKVTEASQKLQEQAKKVPEGSEPAKSAREPEGAVSQFRKKIEEVRSKTSESETALPAIQLNRPLMYERERAIVQQLMTEVDVPSLSHASAES